MNVINSLLVELGVNTGAFVAGLNKATYETQRFGRDVQQTFQKMSNSIGMLAGSFGAFGPAGMAVAETFTRMGQAAGGAIQHFAGVNKTLGVFAGIGAGAAAGAISAGVAAIGLAVHASEAATKLYNLSQATGLSVPVLSGLAIVAKIGGVELDQLARGVEKMDKNVVKSATSTQGSVDAFTRLHIAVRDTHGQIKSSDQLFFEIANKFSTMKDGAVKTALAIQIFGRAGADLIPILNRGGEELKTWLDYGKKVGAVMSEEMAASAHHFHEEMTKLQLVFTGVENKLMVGILPALTRFVEKMTDLTSRGNLIETWGNAVGKALLFVTRMLLETIHAWDVLKIRLEEISAIGASGVGVGVEERVESAGGPQRSLKEMQSDIAKLDARLATDIADLYKPVPPPPKVETPKDTTDLSRAHGGPLEHIKDRIRLLEQEAPGWQRIAQAGSSGLELIAEAGKRANTVFGELLSAAAKDPAATSYVKQREAIIRSSAALEVYSKAVKATNDSLDKQGKKFEEQASDADALAAAYQKGGAAIADAFLNSHFAAQRAEIKTLRDTYAELSLTIGDKISPTLNFLARAIDAANKKLADNTLKLRVDLSKELSKQLVEEQYNFTELAPLVDRVNNAYIQGESAVRAARLELQLQTFAVAEHAKGILDLDTKIEQQRRLLKEKDAQAYDGIIKQEAAKFSLNALYEQEIVRLQKIKAALEEQHEATVLVDAALQNAMIAFRVKVDEATMATGTLRERFAALLDVIKTQAANPWKEVFADMLHGVEQLEDKLAEFIATGKADFKSLAVEMEKSIIKVGIKDLFGKVAVAIEDKLGIHRKETLGTAGNPMHVIIDSGGALGGLLGGAGSAVSGGGGILGTIGGVLGGGFGGLFSGITGLFSGISGAVEAGTGAGLTGAFGGALAEGGDVSPGKAYIVGEKHPEFFIPKQSGSVVPTIKTGGGITNVLNINGVADADSFKRSQGQIFSALHAQMTLARQRNG